MFGDRLTPPWPFARGVRVLDAERSTNRCLSEERRSLSQIGALVEGAFVNADALNEVVRFIQAILMRRDDGAA